MLDIFYSKKFKKELKLMIKRGYKLNKFNDVVDILINCKPLPAKYLDHTLNGNYIGFRECHIEPDWLLIYRIQNDTLTLVLSRTGTHSDLF